MKIEKNIKIEDCVTSGYGSMKQTIERMDVGDSVFIDNRSKLNSFRAASSAFGAEVGRKFSSRKVEGGWRVWRIE